MVTPAFQPYVLPSAAAILVALFAIQPLGTSWIGRAFGPVMALWFLVMAVLGIWGIAQHPTVVAAVNPASGLRFLVSDGYASRSRGALCRHGALRVASGVRPIVTAINSQLTTPT